MGLSLGRQTVHSFTACMDSSLRMMLWQEGRRSVRGLEASLRFGGLQHKPDLIALPMTNLKTGGVGMVGLGKRQALLARVLPWKGAVGRLQHCSVRTPPHLVGADATLLPLPAPSAPPAAHAPCYSRHQQHQWLNRGPLVRLGRGCD